MLRRTFLGIAALALGGAAGLTEPAYAQAKQMPQPSVKSINPRIVDINAAPEADLIAAGIDRSAAKKIVDGRPWRSKRDLLTKEVLTKEQYEKLNKSLVAKRPKKG